MENLLNAGESLFAQGKLKEAEASFLDFLEKNPRNEEALNNLGVIQYARGNLREAESYFLEALGVKEDYREAMLNLADLYKSMDGGEQTEHQKEENPRKDDNASSAPGNGNGSRQITMKKQLLIEVLKKVCYLPHPEVRKGRLILSKEIFDNEDRETNVVISPGAMLDLTGDITVGPWTMIGAGTTVWTHDHYHYGRDKPLLKLQEEKGVKWLDKMVGRDVWLHGCTILPQVTEIPDGVVVGAGSVLTKNPGAYEIWAGNPARKIGER